MKPLVTMREALTDPQLLAGALPGESWATWRTMLIAAMGEPLNAEERAFLQSVTGRESEPLQLVEELWCIVGRRGGKTRAAGTLAAYVGGLCDHSGVLAPGERGVIPILSAGVYAAGRVFMHAKGILLDSPLLAEQLDGEPTQGTIRLRTLVDIEVRPANFRTIRGITAVAAVADEIAFWHVEGSTNPDDEILGALRPSLGTTGGPLMVISSPYARRGELWATYRRDYGPAGDPQILVAKAPTRTFNPTFDQRTIDRAYARDPATASAEYGGEFRKDIEAFVSLEVVEACVSPGVYERPPISGVAYQAFVDPSGGVNDSMTLAIAHREGERAVLDVLRERKPPFSPEAVVEEFARQLKDYGLRAVCGDRYGGEWPREAFRRHGISYELADQPRSDLYRDALPLLNSGRLDLLDNATLVAQLVGLERRVNRGGRESIDHAPGGHDDLANAVAGVVGRTVRRQAPTTRTYSIGGMGAGALTPFGKAPGSEILNVGGRLVLRARADDGAAPALKPAKMVGGLI